MSNESDLKVPAQGPSEPEINPDGSEREARIPEGARKRHWVFTFFPEDQSRLSAASFYESAKDWLRYLVVGHEICPDTGRYHWQGHMFLFRETSRKGLATKVFKALKKHARLAVSVAWRKSVEYCKKGGDSEEFGDPPRQGARSDVDGMVRDVREGHLTPDDVALLDPEMYRQYHRSFEIAAIRYNLSRKRDWVPEVIFVTGPTGTGKTRFVWSEEEDHDDLFVYPYEQSGWCDLYTGQEAILFDDFRGQVSFTEMLRICDRYPYSLKRRGKPPFPLLAKRIYITSSLDIDNIYRDDRAKGESLLQLKRRITRLIRLDVADNPSDEICGQLLEDVTHPWKEEVNRKRQREEIDLTE